MVNTLRLLDGAYMRHPDVRRILEFLFSATCVEVLGISNIGKSALLRLLAQPDVWIQELGEAGREFLPVYVDCNRMVDMTDQGFYELLLRCLQESSPQLAENRAMQEAYITLVNPESEFQVPLSFNRGITAALEESQAKIVLLLDEFDEPFERIPSRVFLNLRAKKDRHPDDLAYVTATYRPLTDLRSEDHCMEFCELFAHQRWHLAPLIHSDVERFVMGFAEERNAHFIQADLDFIYAWAGGHPGILQGVCLLLADALTREFSALRGGGRVPDPEGTAHSRRQVHRGLPAVLLRDPYLRSECEKIWGMCPPGEQAALLGLVTGGDEVPRESVDLLIRRHLLLESPEGPRPFCRLFREFLQRQANRQKESPSRLWLDETMGTVLLDGQPVETLTNLEYRLMTLLFQNAEKIVDKYEIVASVWGEGYIDEVDDARIEKLISRLRQKVEPVPGEPRFLVTVRGRGYRLLPEPES